MTISLKRCSSQDGYNIATGNVATGNAAASHMRTPAYGAAPAGSDLAARGGNIATGDIATGNVATGNSATSHMHAPAPPPIGSDLATRGDIATGNVATGNAATAASKYREGGDPASKGGAHVVGQVHEDDVAATHPESASKSETCNSHNFAGC